MPILVVGVVTRERRVVAIGAPILSWRWVMVVFAFEVEIAVGIDQHGRLLTDCPGLVRCFGRECDERRCWRLSVLISGARG